MPFITSPANLAASAAQGRAAMIEEYKRTGLVNPSVTLLMPAPETAAIQAQADKDNFVKVALIVGIAVASWQFFKKRR